VPRLKLFCAPIYTRKLALEYANSFSTTTDPWSCFDTHGGNLAGAAPCAVGRGYIRAPGVYTEAHLEGWKLVTDAVHSKGGFIFCQLMHAGRVSHSSLLPDNQLPVAPSAVKLDGLVHIKDGAKVPYETPRALETNELPGVVAEFKNAAKNAISCGFDGIELHGGVCVCVCALVRP
jgi:2,4-dienoyl-CoA reductase-like NADH-dependent reductase (Old Yellow Enzyme family)